MPRDPDDPRSWFPLRVATLAYARDCLNVREEGHNIGRMVETFQRAAGIRPGDPWCAAFVNWCAEKAAELKGVTSPLEAVPLEGYVQSYVDYGGEQNWIRGDDDTPGVGDLVCFYYNELGRYGHIGFVEEIESSTIKTIEGNTGPDGGREGEGVHTRIRNRQIEGVVYLDWTRNLDEEQP